MSSSQAISMRRETPTTPRAQRLLFHVPPKINLLVIYSLFIISIASTLQPCYHRPLRLLFPLLLSLSRPYYFYVFSSKKKKNDNTLSCCIRNTWQSGAGVFTTFTTSRWRLRWLRLATAFPTRLTVISRPAYIYEREYTRLETHTRIRGTYVYIVFSGASDSSSLDPDNVLKYSQHSDGAGAALL